MVNRSVILRKTESKFLGRSAGVMHALIYSYAKVKELSAEWHSCNHLRAS